ncbi:unnamed protein product [Cunninghamella echinulata]
MKIDSVILITLIMIFLNVNAKAIKNMKLNTTNSVTEASSGTFDYMFCFTVCWEREAACSPGWHSAKSGVCWSCCQDVMK